MTQSVRHFGYLWQAQAAQVADPSITVSEATALAYPVSVNHGTSTITVSAPATSRQVYEACMADLCQTANQGTTKHISTADLGATFTTTYTVAFTGTGAITGSYTDASGLHVAASASLPVSGCRVQLYDVTNAVELDNSVVSGTSYVFPLTYTGARTLRLRVAYVSGTTAQVPQEVFGALTSGGAAFTVLDAPDTVYGQNAIDGAVCDSSSGGEFTADFPNVQIDVSDPDGVTTVQRLYAWACWNNTQTSGIRQMFAAVTAQDELNYTINQDVINLKFDNISASPVVISGGYIKRKDSSTVIAATSGSIQMDPSRAYLANGTTVASDVWSNTKALTVGKFLALK